MNHKAVIPFLLCAVCGLTLPSVRAQEAAAEEAAASAEEAANPELDEAVAYVEALVNNGYPDFAEQVSAEVKAKWPEADVQLFAIDVRGLLSLGKFEEAERKIAALPDRKGSKYWAARLEMANNYFFRNMKAECLQIYDEFFKAFAKPPKELQKFFVNASYSYGQLLFEDRQYARAAKAYDALLPLVKGKEWCHLASETAKVYMKLADELGRGKNESALASAEKIVDKLLWHQDKPVFFGQAVSMKAHIAVMRGKPDRARDIVEEYLPVLQELHAQMQELDPDGTQGLLRLSPLPECLYLQAKMLWDAAQEAYKAPKRDDEKVKSYMFGARDPRSGRRDGKGAFNLAVTVFLRFDTSPWAVSAGELSEEVREFAEKHYNAKIKTNVTKEQIAKMRAAQFKEAGTLFLSDRYAEAIEAYYAALEKYPELPESVQAVANIASALLDLYAEEKDEAQKELHRLDADAVGAYLSERFAGNADRSLMLAAGDATISLAAKERERGDPGRADWLLEQFCTNYRRHPNAPQVAASQAGAAQKAEDYSEAIARWKLLGRYYTNSTYYASSLAQIAFCCGKLGDAEGQMAYMADYLKIEKNNLLRLQAQMQLAQMYQKAGLERLSSAETNETAEAVAAAEKAGSALVIRAIQQFSRFSGEAAKAVADPATTKADREKYETLREAALFLVGECYGRITRPEAALAKMRERAAKSYEEYVEAYPEGKYVKTAYVKLGMIYTAMNEMEKSKDALDRLSRAFPDSEEAKNAKPRLAKSLMEIGMRKEATEIYGEMLHTDGKYTAGQYLNAGEALIEAKSWDLANQAFEKAIRLAGTNQVTTVAKARLGLAKTSFRQGSLAEAREAIDLFLEDPKMSRMLIAADANFLLVEVAKEQGRREKDAVLRAKHFNAAVGALRKVKGYWAKKPQWEQDRLELLSGDVVADRVKAEEEMGLAEEALESCGKAASKFLSFIQAKSPTESRPLSAFEAGERDNLERAYASAVALWSHKGMNQADFVIRYGNEYLALFPNGKFRTEVVNNVNQAKADSLGSATSEAKPAAPAETSENETTEEGE